MSDGLSDANRPPDYSRDPMFAICNVCGLSWRTCAVDRIGELEAAIAASNAQTDALIVRAEDAEKALIEECSRTDALMTAFEAGESRSLIDVLTQLADASDHLLLEHDCDFSWPGRRSSTTSRAAVRCFSAGRSKRKTSRFASGKTRAAQKEWRRQNDSAQCI